MVIEADPGSSSQADHRCYLCPGTTVPGSNGRCELLFLVGNEPEEFTLHAIVDFPGERSLNFPETEGPRNGPAGPPPVRSPVDTVHAGIRCGRADPQLLHLLSSGIPPAFPELPTVDLGHGFFHPPTKKTPNEHGPLHEHKKLPLFFILSVHAFGVQEIPNIIFSRPRKGRLFARGLRSVRLPRQKSPVMSRQVCKSLKWFSSSSSYLAAASGRGISSNLPVTFASDSALK